MREKFEKKDTKRLHIARVEFASSQVQHGSDNHTLETTPNNTPNPSAQVEKHIGSVSLKLQYNGRNVNMCQTSL